MSYANESDVAAFLREYCAIDDARPPIYVRAKIGSVKKTAKVWSFAPLYLTENAGQMARQVMQRLGTERIKTDTEAWIQVFEKGEHNEIATMSSTVFLAAVETGEESEAPKGMDGMVTAVITGQGNMLDIIQRGHEVREHAWDEERGRWETRLKTLLELMDKKDARILELTEKVFNERLANAEQRAQMSANDPMSNAISTFGPQIVPALQDLATQYFASRAAEGGAKSAPKAEGEEEPDHGKMLDDCIALVSQIVLTHPDALTKERFIAFLPAGAIIQQRAYKEGWIPNPDPKS